MKAEQVKKERYTFAILMKHGSRSPDNPEQRRSDAEIKITIYNLAKKGTAGRISFPNQRTEKGNSTDRVACI